MSAQIEAMLLTHAVEQFYYREARLLDERCFQQWLNLLDSTIQYLMPSRHVAQPDPELRGREEFLALRHDVGGADAASSPIRFDGFLHLLARAMRPFKVNAWAESPPPRTRRSVSNVEILSTDEESITVTSNFQMFYSHHGASNHTYVGCRKDVLLRHQDSFKILRREVVVDWDIVTGPTLALLF